MICSNELYLRDVETHQAWWMCWISSKTCSRHALAHRWQCTKSADRHIVKRLWLDCRIAIVRLWIDYAIERRHCPFELPGVWNSPWVHQVTYTWLMVAFIDSNHKMRLFLELAVVSVHCRMRWILPFVLWTDRQPICSLDKKHTIPVTPNSLFVKRNPASI